MKEERGHSPRADHVGPATSEVVEAVLAAWPEHAKFVRHSFASPSPELAATREAVSKMILQVAEDRGKPLSSWAEDYRFLCEKIILPEELFFRRNDRYRLSTFADAAATVYGDAEFMTRYMNGLLISDVLWLNHARAMQHFRDSYLGHLPAGGEHLEIGPGHGLLLHLALQSERFDAVSAWDVSPTSVAHTRQTIFAMAPGARVDIRQQNFLAPDLLKDNAGRFSSVVLSEVLEHLEQPHQALSVIRELLEPELGMAWLNVPANAPAPDHLFLLRSLDQLLELVQSAGLEAVDSAAFPLAGATLERAVRDALAVSCVVIAKRRRV